MKSTLLSTLVAGLFITGAAFAQTSPPASTSMSAPDRAAKMQQHFDQHFSKSDKNGDGFIDRDEAAGNKRLAEHFDEIDSNKDGKLSKDELKAHFAASHAKAHEKFEAKFKAADKDGDGTLSKEEAQAAKMPHIVKNFDAIDANKDGKVTPEELRAFMASQHKAHASS
jgi:Ca2+-binding EF-hand superfamily protein